MFSTTREFYSYILWRFQEVVCQMEKHLEVWKNLAHKLPKARSSLEDGWNQKPRKSSMWCQRRRWGKGVRETERAQEVIIFLMILLQNGEVPQACHLLINAACLGNEKYPQSDRTKLLFVILSAWSSPFIMLRTAHSLKIQKAHCLTMAKVCHTC